MGSASWARNRNTRCLRPWFQQASIGYALRGKWKPDRAMLLIDLHEMDAFGPKRRFLGRFAFSTDERVVLGIHPDAAFEQVRLAPFRTNLQNVGRAACCELRSDKRKLVILRVQPGGSALLGPRRFRLRLEHFVQDVLVRRLPSVFG